jgi:hypothetical protein
VELTEECRAQLDFYIYDKEGLLSNLMVVYENGKITKFTGLNVRNIEV